MKLRIQGNSLRLRLLQSDVARFVETGRIEEKIYFAPGDQGFLIYSLEHAPDLSIVQVRHKTSEVTVVVPSHQASSWAETDQTGIYSVVDLGGNGKLEVVIEKDFACLDLSDAENKDTFPNPQVASVC